MRQRLRSYAARMGRGAFFTHHSAAVCWGLPVPLAPGALVHVAVLAPHRAPRGAGIVGHAISPHLVTVREHDGLRVSSPASVWVQLGAVLEVADLVAVGDAIIRVPRGRHGRLLDASTALATLDQLEAAAHAGNRKGAARIRAALPLLRQGASSRPETHLRISLLGAGLPEPELDGEVRSAAGLLLGISEIVFRTWRVAVEYEGDQHRTDRRQWNRDIHKYEAYRAAGWHVIRITAEHLYGRRPIAVARVRDGLMRAGWRPDPS